MLCQVEIVGQKCPVLSGIEIYERRDELGIVYGQARHLGACDGVAHDHRLRNAEGVKALSDIAGKRGSIVTGLRLGRFSKAAPCERYHAKMIGEPRRKLFEDMGAVACAGKEDEELAVTTEIEIVELHTRIGGDETRVRSMGVAILGGCTASAPADRDHSGKEESSHYLFDWTCSISEGTHNRKKPSSGVAGIDKNLLFAVGRIKNVHLCVKKILP